MSYQPFLIANFATGLDKEVQPWLLPNDAFTELFDGFVYRGVAQIRNGYAGYAVGLNSIACESRIVHNISASSKIQTGDIDGLNDTFEIQVFPDIIPGSLVISGSNPVQVVTDDGIGGLIGDGTGTINYVTGIINVVFTAPPALASTITITYANFAVGDGGANYIVTLANTPIRRGTIVITAGAQVVTDDGVGNLTGDGMGTIDYTTGDVNVTFNAIVALGDPITIVYDYHPGLPVMGVMSFYPSNNIRQMLVGDTKYINKYDPSTDRLIDITPLFKTYNNTPTDFWASLNYPAADSTPRLLFCNGVNGDIIQLWNGSTITDYAPTFPATVTTLNASQIAEVSDRLVLFKTIENGTLQPRRMRISGFGANTDSFANTSPGAGFIDIPDNTWFYGQSANRNDTLLFTETSTWTMKYTANDVTPFQLFRIDNSRGSKSIFSVYSYLSRTIAISPQGLIESDGYNVDRMDNNIPDFTFNEVKDSLYDHIFSGFLDEERDVYLIYPSQSAEKGALVPTDGSDRILVINFEEDNFAIYRLPLSCMGSFQETQAIVWDDLTDANGYPTWDALGAKFGSWNAFPFNVGAPIGIGGGHKGEVWELNTDEAEDNPLNIRDVTFIASTESGSDVTITTDWNNYEIGDMIFFEDIGGIFGINNKQARIIDISTDYTTFTVNIYPEVTGAYTSGGTTSRVIPFSLKTKPLNPFINMDKKLKIGWIYLYVETTSTWLEDDDGNPVPAILNLDVFTDDNPNKTTPNFAYEIDCTNPPNQQGVKRWVKIWINQVGKFLQIGLRNEQAGANMKVHAIMPGMAAIGRLV